MRTSWEVPVFRADGSGWTSVNRFCISYCSGPSVVGAVGIGVAIISETDFGEISSACIASSVGSREGEGSVSC